VLTPSDREILRVLGTVPFVPMRVLSEVLGMTSASMHRRLRRLQATGLATPVLVPCGGSGRGRPLALWCLSPQGEALVAPPDGAQRPQRLPRQWPRLVAAYDLVGALAVGLSMGGRRATLQAWEAPWRRSVAAPSARRSAELPAAAVLGSAGSDRRQRVSLLLLPDLGWAAVALHRGLLARLLALRGGAASGSFPTLVVATVSAPGRAEAWRDLLARVAVERGEAPLSSVVVTWSEVRERRLDAVLQSGAGSPPATGTLPGGAAGGRAAATGQRPVAGTATGPGSERRLLQLVGRHPFLPLAHVADLLGMRRRQARAGLERLATAGLVRWVGEPEAEGFGLDLAADELAALELSELTREGLRVLAAALGLSLARAQRLHGLAGGGPEQPTRTRWPLLRALAHTLGADAVFVALHVALSRIPGDGLVRWDNAAASMRGRCRPDGYGVCRVGGRDVGFFLEYDRCTESARDYAAKWAGYYAYRDSGRAAADYASFPTILVVTAGPEERVLRSARAAAVGRPGSALPILLTTTGWIDWHPQGIVGPIWRTPNRSARGYWLRAPPPPGRPIGCVRDDD
jgi:Replication-relaxation/Winged helix-turn-helix DNA-binding